MRELCPQAGPGDRRHAGRGPGQPAEPEDPGPGLDPGHQLPRPGHRHVPVLQPGERRREVLPELRPPARRGRSGEAILRQLRHRPERREVLRRVRHPGRLSPTVSSALYRILSPAGQEREDGSADVKVADGALVLAPAAGAVLRIPFGHIASVTEPEPFTVRVTLADGNAIDLSRLGVMRTQLLAELRDGRGDAAASAAAAVGEAVTFSGTFSGPGGGETAEIRVYDDLLLVVGPAASDRISFS